MDLGFNYFFMSSLVACSYSVIYIVTRNMKNVIIDNYKEINALKIKVNRLIYCHEQIMTKIIAIEKRLNIDTFDKSASTEDLTLETCVDNDNVEQKCHNNDNVEQNCNDNNKSTDLNIYDTYEDLDCVPIIQVPKSKSWLQKIYS